MPHIPFLILPDCRSISSTALYRIRLKYALTLKALRSNCSIKKYLWKLIFGSTRLDQWPGNTKTNSATCVIQIIFNDKMFINLLMKREKIKAIHIIVVTIVTVEVWKIIFYTLRFLSLKQDASSTSGCSHLIFWFDCTHKRWDHSTYSTLLALHASSITDKTTQNKTKPKYSSTTTKTTRVNKNAIHFFVKCCHGQNTHKQSTLWHKKVAERQRERRISVAFLTVNKVSEKLRKFLESSWSPHLDSRLILIYEMNTAS